MSSFWRSASLAVAVAALCGCSTMKDSTRFDDLPSHYWNSLATGHIATAGGGAMLDDDRCVIV